ncbi:2-phospho-L-lactate guanylyltransferase [Leisingera sp. McT4-56]|uniref:2-phospho-L-lactate guanylyltransferase n=1 Tax=Leisingera sp. McT4-56 TaxID=2881255 RepID=UPI001CF87A53|nr:2-phospho-L-lactate guanylyltransferase [Leisingera sp. McT4-56]MCB4458213.1 2-phospho-L-lactate guanylyltransferase [Leisingera sp. McT4-56]
MTRGTNSGKRLAVIPMKDPSKAKTRLAVALTPQERKVLAEGLFQATVSKLQEALARLPGDAVDIAVVSHSPVIARIAHQAGLICIDDQDPGSLSLAVEAAAGWAAQQGYGALCVLPGDLAAPSVDDLTRLLAHPLDEASAVFCPAKDLGTNALLAPLPCPFPFRYGRKSLIAHLQAAEAAGLCPKVLPLASLRIDVDTAEDLDHLLAHNPRALVREGAQ